MKAEPEITAHNTLSQALQAAFYAEIPLTRHLGLQVASYDGQTLALAAPLEPNVNHKHTAFAGSLNSVVTLAGWGLLWLILKEEAIGGKIVIQDSTINYWQPVTTNFRAVCQRPESVQLNRFLNLLKKKGLARLELTAAIENEKPVEQPELADQEKLVLVSFTGRYVAHKLKS